MLKVRSLIYLLLIVISLLSCSDNSSASCELLLQAQDLIENDPKRALALLDSIAFPKDMGEEAYMQYIVACVQAKRKNSLSVAGDTLIFEAQNYFNKKGDPQQAVLANFYAGTVCDQSEIWDRAIDCFQQSIQYGYKAKDNLMVAKSYHTLGIIFYDNNLLDSAVVNYNQALEYYNKLSNVDIYKMQILNRIGTIYDISCKYDEAENYFKQSFDIASQTENKLYQGYGNQNLGLVCLDRKNYNTALVYFHKALPDMASTVDSIKIYLSLSKLYTKTHQLDSAVYFTSIVKKTLPQITDNRTLAYTYEVLKSYYEKEQDYKEALRYSTLCDSVLRGINNHELIQQLHEAETKRELAVLQEKADSKQKLLISWVIASYLVLLLLVVSAVAYFRMRARMQAKMQQQKMEQEKKRMIERKKKEKEIAEVRDSFFLFNAGINYKVMNQWRDICEKIIEMESMEMEDAKRQEVLPRIGKTMNLIHKKTSSRLVKIGKEFLSAEPNGETALRYLKDKEILCMMLAYHKYPYRVVEVTLDKPNSQKEFERLLGSVEGKLRVAKFTEERINEILYPGKPKKIYNLM